MSLKHWFYLTTFRVTQHPLWSKINQKWLELFQWKNCECEWIWNQRCQIKQMPQSNSFYLIIFYRCEKSHGTTEEKGQLKNKSFLFKNWFLKKVCINENYSLNSLLKSFLEFFYRFIYSLRTFFLKWCLKDLFVIYSIQSEFDTSYALIY
jgi:hypothetical protein